MNETNTVGNFIEPEVDTSLTLEKMRRAMKLLSRSRPEIVVEIPQWMADELVKHHINTTYHIVEPHLPTKRKRRRQRGKLDTKQQPL